MLCTSTTLPSLTLHLGIFLFFGCLFFSADIVCEGCAVFLFWCDGQSAGVGVADAVVERFGACGLEHTVSSGVFFVHLVEDIELFLDKYGRAVNHGSAAFSSPTLHTAFGEGLLFFFVTAAGDDGD